MFEFAKGLLYANKLKFENGEFRILDQSCLVTFADTIIAMQKKIIDKLGDKGIDILYNSSKDEGIELAKEFNKKIKSKNELEDFILKYLMLCGWGEFEEYKKSHEGVILFNKNSPFPERYGRSKLPVCILIRGLLAGVYTYLAGKNFEGYEEKCKSQGNNMCIFKFIPKS